MSSTVLAALATAGALGVTHAIEPDHVAGISSLTSEYGDSRLSALVGACFSLGHVALVVAWLAVASFVLGRTEFSPVLDAIGTVGAGVILGLLGAAMAVGGLRRVVRTDAHDHDGHTHSHPHVHLPLPGFDGHDHDHDTVSYLKTGLVGALFTLSPPVSMIAFSTTLLPDYGTGVVSLAVVTYGLTITATMSLLGAGAGALFGLTRNRSTAVHGAAQTVAGLAVAGLAATLLVDAVPTLL
jgi:nickel/cobalt exporter